MFSGIITAIIALAFIALIVENIGTIIIGAIIIFLLLGGLVWMLVKLTTPKYPYITKNCPWGYHKYGCHPDCPMHEHCWGPHPMKENSTQHNHSFWEHQDSDSGQSFLPDTPTSQNEDGDWRTVYMDDTRYDDREHDEEFDHDRDNNGGW